MPRSCDNLRAEALLKGLSSPAGQQWRSHAEHCSACRSELRILRDLGEQDRGNLHLKRSSVEQLLQEVDRQGRHYRRLTPMRVALQLAVAGTVALCALILYSTGAAIGTLSSSENPTFVRNTLERVASDMLGENGSQPFGSMEFTSAFAEEAPPAAPSGTPTADDIDSRLTHLRQCIDRERADLLRVCDPEVDSSYWMLFGEGFDGRTGE